MPEWVSLISFDQPGNLVYQFVARFLELLFLVRIYMAGTEKHFTYAITPTDPIKRIRSKHIDFPRDLIRVAGTKTRKKREVPMNPEVRGIMLRLCRSKSVEDYVFVSPRLADV